MKDGADLLGNLSMEHRGGGVEGVGPFFFLLLWKASLFFFYV